MLLIIDIGNTNITCGIFHNEDLIVKFSIKSRVWATSDELGMEFIQYLSLYNQNRTDLEAVVIASVVPSLTEMSIQSVKKFLGITPNVVGLDLDIGLEWSNYQDMAGIDRLVNIYGGVFKYGAPLMVIDIGTALTLDVADKNGAFIGGAIFPGIHSLSNALFRDTARLPFAKVRKPEKVIGTTTDECIISGIYYGYLNAIQGLITKTKAEIGTIVTVVATGGYSSFLEDCSMIDIFDENLTLESIRQIYVRSTSAD